MTENAPVTPRVIVVTASDSRFMPFLRGMLESAAPFLQRPGVSLACFDIGLNEEDRASLQARGAILAKPRAHLGVDADGVNPALLSFLARPFLPSYFPGHDIYVWIDSDVWLQDPSVLQTYLDGAGETGMAITHERTRSYRFQAWLLGWTAKHMVLGYGPADAAFQLTQRHVNAGFFAIAAAAPHWQAWADCYKAAIARSGALVPHDQFALNHAIHGGLLGRSSLPVTLLPPVCNWIADRGVPMWSDTSEAFCDPRPPHALIRAMHLAGPAKRERYRIARTGGGAFETCLLHGAGPGRPLASPLSSQ